MRRFVTATLLAAFSSIALATSAAAEVPSVVATIKPVHSLVAAVMGDLGTPALIVRGGASPHTYSLRPSDAAALEAADLVFWTGHGMELFLEDALSTIAAGARLVELAEAPGIELLPIREGGAFEPHADEGGEHEETGHEGELDMHFWLDPENAKRMVDAIAAALSEADPANAASYAANAAAEKADLDALAAELAATVEPVRDRPFIVFHDAYQYFERRLGLEVAGSVTMAPDSMPGAQRVNELKARIAVSGVACVFAEPQFEPAIVSAIIEGTGARTGTLDPEGATLEEGQGLYRKLLENLARNLVACLSGR